jgi:hypothetical protein
MKTKIGFLILMFMSGLYQLSLYPTTPLYYISGLLGVIFGVIIVNYIWDYIENKYYNNEKDEEEKD